MFVCREGEKKGGVTKGFNLPIGKLIPKLASKYLLHNHSVVENRGDNAQSLLSELLWESIKRSLVTELAETL